MDINETLELGKQLIEEAPINSKGKWKIGDFVYDPRNKVFGTIDSFGDNLLKYTPGVDVQLKNVMEISYNTFRKLPDDHLYRFAISKYLKDGNKYIEKQLQKLQDAIDLYKQVKDNQ